MTRAALLPYPGDPFLLHYWLKFYDQFWADEVDALYIGLNSPLEKAGVDYINEMIQSRIDQGRKIVLDYYPDMADHGPTIRKLLEMCDEDLVMLIEDDGFIFRKGQVDSCFKQIENGSYDVVGGKRGSCDFEILEQAKWIWDLEYSGEGDQGPNFWPNFFFSSKELLLNTDRNFAAKAWKQGENIPELGQKGIPYTVKKEIIYGDTFVNTSLQIRSKVPRDRILCIPQFHGSPDDLDHYRDHKYLFSGLAPWTHVGSLSSGISGVLQDNEGRSLARRLLDPSKGQTRLPREWCQTDAEKREWERRVQWWLTFIEDFYTSPAPKTNIAELSKLYSEAVNRVIEQYKLNLGNIRDRQRAYATIMGVS